MENKELKTYIEVSKKHSDKVVFVKKDDKYIVFYSDMIEILSLMEISINQIPQYELEKYLEFLIKKGKKIVTVG